MYVVNGTDKTVHHKSGKHGPIYLCNNNLVQSGPSCFVLFFFYTDTSEYVHAV